MKPEVLERLTRVSLPSKPLEGKYSEILNFLLKNPGLLPYNIFKFRKNVYKEPKDAWRAVNHLKKNRLIEDMRGDSISSTIKSQNERIPYELSLDGIFYVILHNYDMFHKELVMPLLHNYGSCILFELFLNPHMDQQTLLRIKDDIVFSIIYAYLKDICTTILSSIKSLDKLVFSTDEEDYLLKQLFMWPCDPTLPSNTIPFYRDELRYYLEATFNWDWISHARVEPNYEDSVISIVDPYDSQKSISLRINKKDKKAFLLENGKMIHNFIITEHELFLSIDIRTDKRKIDFFIEYLADKCKNHTTSFLTNLRIQVNSTRPDYQLLSKDQKFVRALEDMEKNVQIR